MQFIRKGYKRLEVGREDRDTAWLSWQKIECKGKLEMIPPSELQWAHSWSLLPHTTQASCPLLPKVAQGRHTGHAEYPVSSRTPQGFGFDAIDLHLAKSQGDIPIRNVNADIAALEPMAVEDIDSAFIVVSDRPTAVGGERGLPMSLQEQQVACWMVHRSPLPLSVQYHLSPCPRGIICRNDHLLLPSLCLFLASMVELQPMSS